MNVDNATITRKGIDYAHKLNYQIGTTGRSQRVASLLHRHARTYDRIQELWCDWDMSDRQRVRLEAKEARLEARIRDLVGYLPEPDNGPWRVQFSGDPRGYTVRLIAPDGREYGIYEGS
jgi:hypothetical protein